MNKLNIGLVGLVILAFTFPTAQARKSKQRKAKAEVVAASSLRLELIDSSLLSVPFGKPVAEVMAWIEKRVGQSYEPKFAAALDARERDTLRHRMRQDLERLRQKIVLFEGQTTGFEASVVQGEFATHAKESLLLFRDDGVDHYLFFSDGTLWKYARPLASTVRFGDRVARWVADQGEPTARQGEGVLKWKGAVYQLRLEDRRLVSASDLLVLEWRKALEAVEALRKVASDEKGQSSAESELDSYFE